MQPNKSVLLVEDDIQLNTTIKNFLHLQGFEVDSVYDGADAIERIDAWSYTLYIVDINIPSVSGLELVRYVRKTDLQVPVIIVTASLELENFKRAFEYGCSEYIKKPFFLEELEIRITNLLGKPKEQKEITIAPEIVYDTEYEELHVEGELVSLRKKERRLLSILLLHVNHTVATEEIEAYVWENEIRESYPLRQLVNDLRKKISQEKNYIVSEIGVGYRFETHNATADCRAQEA